MMTFNVIVIIGSTLLVLLFLLLCAVICLYCKVANALKPSKLSGCLALTNTPAFVAEDKVAGATSITACYPTLQACDQCNLYADVDPLLPCLCDVNEGPCEVNEGPCDVTEGL
ncbi:Protein FAM24A [Galemys pyrenaicus]|uniref:Protein FAM24A n=1 Tax=Galemys pyrenaicus TaxID=202257 RepID=A0A8J6AFF4_GALPY|nr:Protein FAM24A [Galemys pyrenaicus]